MRLIPNGVDTERFRPGPSESTAQVVYAGALREDKGLVELLQALEIVFERHPGATAALAGAPDRWHEIPPRIRSGIERLQMAAPNRLRLLGSVSQKRLADLYRGTRACVFPSHAEAFGLACVEAMSCGAAVVASNLAAGAEIVEDGRSGLLADPRDPAALAGAILRLLTAPSLASALGEQARRRVVERYSMRLTAERTLALYDELRRENQPWLTRSAA
jgi:glycosyltransferase involved in cell wall biosynthesis